MSLLTVLSGGCATRTINNYCEIAQPILFDSENVVSVLIDSDPQLLRDLITHNEIYERLCD
jgi:hypothetical protein